MPYAYARQLDPATGEVVFDQTRSSWAEGHPATEIAVRALRTPIGTAQRDPTYGLDLTGIDPSSKSAAAQIERAIRNCLDRFVKLGLFAILSCAAEIHGNTTFAVLEIQDPRETSGRPQPVRVRLF